MEKTEERKEISLIKGLTIQKKKKIILLAMTRRERTYQREGDVDDLLKKI